jgi:hypothetical protein
MKMNQIQLPVADHLVVGAETVAEVEALLAQWTHFHQQQKCFFLQITVPLIDLQF